MPSCLQCHLLQEKQTSPLLCVSHVVYSKLGLTNPEPVLCLILFSSPGPREIPGCTGRCQVTYCPACYFSKQPRPLPGRCSLCGAPVSSLRCLKRWANCINSADKSRNGLVSYVILIEERSFEVTAEIRNVGTENLDHSVIFTNYIFM